MQRILVTGGAGYIGSHTSLALLLEGYDIFVIDSNINSSKISIEKVAQIYENLRKEKSNKIRFFKGDLRDEDFLKKVFKLAIDENQPIEGIVHFAGLKSVKHSVNNPLEYWDANVNSTISLLKVSKLFNCESIVFSSSATVYGNTNNILIDENSKLDPINPYGESKLAIEKVLKALFKSKDSYWKICILRYFNPIGSHSSGLIGESPLGEPNNIFPIITKVAAKKLEELKVYGDNWNTIDGSGVRDYIHVMDLADGHVKALGKLLNKKPKFLCFNLGTSIGTSVFELIDTFKRVNNIDIPFRVVNRRNGDTDRLVADNSLALKDLNWKPTKTIEDMCRDGWKWKKLNPNGYV